MTQLETAALKPLPAESLADLLTGLAAGHWQAGELLDICQANIDKGDHPDRQIYTRRFDGQAKAEARAIDGLRGAGVPTGELAGLPIALKVLFDVAGEVTHAGSQWWDTPAKADALIVTRLRRAGAVITGHTNMTEFAYSGLGINPHYGTPDNPVAPGRIPGGSSSGAAVAVARYMAAAAIGSDTGGSVRIPSAFCGLVGFKPSQSRIPRTGSFPLSDSLDSIGPMARTVDCCARIDAVLAGQPATPLKPRSLAGLRFAVPTNYMLDDVSAEISDAFGRSLKALRGAGAIIDEVAVPVLDALPELLEGGGFTAAESYHLHRDWLAACGDRYDPRVRTRIERGASLTASDYIELLHRRQNRKQQADQWLSAYDGLLAPTVPIAPPRFEELVDDESYGQLNLLVLRNPTVANLLDLCAITIPNHPQGALPSGLMLVGRNRTDRQLLNTAAGLEKILSTLC